MSNRVVPARVAIVGAAGHIGQAIARRFAAGQSRVVAIDRDGEAVERLAALLGEGHEGHQVDVTDGTLNGFAQGLQPIADAVVYAAGVVTTTTIRDIDWDDYRRLMAVNLEGAFRVAQAFVRPMLETARGGSFVFLSSIAGRRGEAGAAPYCASKAGLTGLIESFAAEMTRCGIRVNGVAPGNVDSPLLRDVARQIARQDGSDAEAIYVAQARVGAACRLVQPWEVAEACFFLASAAASGITGQILTVDVGAMIG